MKVFCFDFVETRAWSDVFTAAEILGMIRDLRFSHCLVPVLVSLRERKVWKGYKTATPSRSMSSSTTRPLYLGARNAWREWSQDELLGDAQGCGFEPRERHRLFSTALKSKLDLHAPIVACWAFNHCFRGILTWLVIFLVLSLQNKGLVPKI